MAHPSRPLLGALPQLASRVESDLPAFVVDASSDEPMWANAAARDLLDCATAWSSLLQDVRRWPLQGAGFRLVRVRLHDGGNAPLLTVRVERIDVAGLGALLVTALDRYVPARPVAPPADERPHPAPLPERLVAEVRPPRRFTWQSDQDGRITHFPDELGCSPGENWEGLLERSALSDTSRLRALLNGRDTWSGVSIGWRAARERSATVELSGLPMFDRDRAFIGFRGFGIVRDEPWAEALSPTDPVALPPEIGPATSANAVEPEQTAPSFTERDHEDSLGEGPADDRALAAEGAETAPTAEQDNEQAPSPIIVFPGVERPNLQPSERSAFQQIAQALGAAWPSRGEHAEQADDLPADLPEPAHAAPSKRERDAESELRGLLDMLPGALLVHRSGEPLHANAAFLNLVGAGTLADLEEAGADGLIDGNRRDDEGGGVWLRRLDGRSVAVEARLKSVLWGGLPASLIIVRQTEPAKERSSGERELSAILDTATDGVLVLDGKGRILSVNRSAEALFGYEAAELQGRDVSMLLSAESHRTTLDYLAGLRGNGLAAVLNDGRDVVGIARRGGTMPLFMTCGRIDEAGEPRFCAVMRDLTPVRRTEEELRSAKVKAERMSRQKSDFLARISHEIRTPLNAITGFTELMIEERFGPLGNDRYRDYLRDIHASGQHIISLVNDLLDLSKIEAGRLELDFEKVDLNEILTQSVALLQPQASRGRIIIRTMLAGELPQVLGDARSLKQIALNLLSNAVRYTPSGGQVIVSTAMTEMGQAMIRIRDTGLGMTEAEISTALEPFRQVGNVGTQGGTGLGLPLTKALVEANRASFSLQSAVGSGTLAEVVFPPAQVINRPH
ncbi:PAS domain-containing sensor histidine kinase [Terrihabitans rhizophilus]|uniref:histidine kinase n=1 Tax=Terrihabitans rhizophilus TaxID=3092662 RepID=A0ABU4RPU0_9HYPH|nr:PAS domain-containing sensor histidine kinase [Terrihabitans sp. PJ23]MDX6806858.1 PAS domain-containing sensor histidine kinase [Terrihabitans sp. PJ23]